MESGMRKKLHNSVKNLEAAVTAYRNKVKGDNLSFLALSKALEVFMEYAWKEMKKIVEADGLLAPTPKEAIRQAAVAGLIRDPEEWLKVLAARNDSVHDYFSIPESDYEKLAAKCLLLFKESSLAKR